MSLLLDALHKADQERKNNDGIPSINSQHDVYITSIPAKKSRKLIIAAAIILIFLLLSMVFWLGKKNQQISARQTLESSAHNKLAENTSQQEDKNESAIRSQESNKHPTQEEQNVASLYQQTEPRLKTVEPKPLNKTEIENSKATVEIQPISQDVNTISTSATPKTAPNSILQFSNLPDIQDLPNAVLQQIPSLKYTEHNYNSYGGSVKINGNLFHTNDQVAHNVVLEKILIDGIILHIDNYSFKMRALNTWVNM
jgi:general secretion pathway protein B